MKIEPEMSVSDALDESRQKLVELLGAARREESRGSDATLRPRVGVDTAIPLSFAQGRLWFLEEFQPTGAAYHIPTALRLTGKLHVPALQQAIEEIVARHDVLRVRFEVRGGQPVQVIDPPSPDTWQFRDLSEVPAAEREHRMLELLRETALAPFDLRRGGLLRATLVKLTDREHVFLITMHHIVSDGWSMSVLLRELRVLYDAYAQGRRSPLPPLEVQYADYAVWQRNWLQGDVLQRQLDYWKAKLADAPTTLELPSDHPRPAAPTYKGAVKLFALPPALSERVAALAKQEGVTLYMLLLAALQVVLSRWSGQRELLIGSPIAGRTQRQTEHLIGFFVNTLVMRGDLRGNPTFRELLARTRETALDAYAHQDLPFEKLVEELRPERDLSRQALFQVWFLFQDLPPSTGDFFGLESQPVNIPLATAKFDLTMSMFQSGTGLGGLIEYATDLFDEPTIDRLVSHYIHLLEQVVDRPQMRLSEVRLITAQERRQLADWNHTEQPYPLDRGVHELFDEQAARTPNATAVVHESGAQLTYAELQRRSNQLAHYLRGKGVGPEDVVGVCVERSIDMIVAVLGILKAGGAYLPLDPTYPAQRVAFMIADARASMVLTHAATRDVLSAGDTAAMVLDLDAAGDELARQPASAPSVAFDPENLAYVIYTSGSTGEPKGTMLRHRGLTNMAVSHVRAFDGRPDDRVLQLANSSFDVSIAEITMALLMGGTLCLITASRASDGTLAQTLRDLRITTAMATASFLRLLSGQRFPDLRSLVSGGEACSSSAVAEWAPQCRFINAYGPTETTVWATYAVCSTADEEVPIGRPIANAQAYVLDEELEPVPVGIVGELYIGGAGLARGYVGHGGLTASRFVANPFAAPGSRMYRTGDRARYRDRGTLEFRGRVDHQLKVRGFRIEPGEIEQALLRHPAVRNAVVVPRDTDSETDLVAYVVPANPAAATDANALRAFLEEILPRHLVPGVFVSLETLPLTPNGKVDRKRLPAPEQVADTENYVAPRTPAEAALARVWSDVLNVEPVGIHDNFFDLGGMSLKAMRVVGQAAEAGLVFTAADLFEWPTIAELAAKLSLARAEAAQPSHIDGEVPLLPIQQLFVRQWPQHFDSFTIEAMFEAAQSLDPGWLRRAVQYVAAHHDALSLQLVFDTTVVQHIVPAERVQYEACFEEVTVSHVATDEEERAIDRIGSEARRRITPAAPPLLHAVLINRRPGQPQLFLVVAHHYVADTWSMQLLMDDIQTVYRQLAAGQPPELPRKTASLKAWAEELRTYARSAQFEADLSMWHAGRWSDYGTIPIDYPGRDYEIGCDETLQVGIENPEADALLDEIRREQRTQLTDVYLTALGATLLAWTGKPAVAIDLISNGRATGFAGLNVARTVGWFSTPVPVLLDKRGTIDTADLLNQVKQCLRGLPNDGLAYGIGKWLLEDAALVAPPHVALNNWGGQASRDSLFRSTGRAIRNDQAPHFRRQHLIDVVVAASWQGLRVTWIYNSKLHRRETIARLAEAYLTHLRGMAVAAV